MFSIEHLNTLRSAEIDKIVTFFRPGARVLEIGAGTGQQALDLAKRGIDIAAIEIPDSNYAQARLFPIIDYDGRHIPFDDASFDIVFSSNVMEHISRPAPDKQRNPAGPAAEGYCVHVMPDPYLALLDHALGVSYRIPIRRYAQVTIAATRDPNCVVLNRSAASHRVRALEYRAQELGRRLVAGRPPSCRTLLPTSPWRTWQYHLRTLAVSPKLVAARISRRRVRAHQRRADGIVLHGNMTFGSGFSLARREKLAKVLGSACHLYQMQPNSALRALHQGPTSAEDAATPHPAGRQSRSASHRSHHARDPVPRTTIPPARSSVLRDEGDFHVESFAR